MQKSEALKVMYALVRLDPTPQFRAVNAEIHVASWNLLRRADGDDGDDREDQNNSNPPRSLS